MATDAIPLPHVVEQQKKQRQDEATQLDIYQAGRRTWDERYRSIISQKNFLAGALLLSLMGNGFQGAENYRKSGHSELVPYVIQTDSQGRILNTEVLKDRAFDENFGSEKTIKGELSSWVEDWRTVSKDHYSTVALVEHTMNMVDANSEAANWITNWYKQNRPDKRGQNSHVDVIAKNVIPESKQTYELYWEERETAWANTAPIVTRWRSRVTVTINPPKNEGAVKKNRYGLYVTHIMEPQMEPRSAQ